MISVVRDDPLFRLQRRIGLIPASGLGLLRRALFWPLLCWLPIVAWGALSGHVPTPAGEEPLLSHFGVHVRFLVALPLLILAEGVAHGVTTSLMGELERAGILPDAEAAKRDEVLARARRLRDAVLPWILGLALVVAWSARPLDVSRLHELEWDVGATHHLGFGAIWYLYVAKPIYTYAVLVWLWRAVQTFLVCLGIARLDLQLAPTHPDRMGGLAELERLPMAFSLVVLGISTAVAAGWAHGIVYHEVDVRSLGPQAAALVAVLLVVFLSPLVAFALPMSRAKRRGILDYGKLIGDHARMVQRRWIRRQHLEDASLLEASEIGCVADANAIYEAVRNMRIVPVGMRAIAAVAIPAAIPLLVVAALQIPAKTLLLQLLRAVL